MLCGSVTELVSAVGVSSHHLNGIPSKVENSFPFPPYPRSVNLEGASSRCSSLVVVTMLTDVILSIITSHRTISFVFTSSAYTMAFAGQQGETRGTVETTAVSEHPVVPSWSKFSPSAVEIVITSDRETVLFHPEKYIPLY